MKDKIFGVLQRVGRSFMLPIALLPVAGLLLGIGSSFTNQTMLEAYSLTGVIYEGSVAYTILDIMNQCGSAVFNNLALLFAMGVAIGMAKKEKEVAALSGAIAYLVMNTAISAMITARGGVEAMAANSTTSTLGITTLQMGVFGGIIVGLGVAALHNRFYKIQLPQVLSFFGGTRFVPIVSTAVYLVVGIAMFYLWPIVQNGIAALGNLVIRSGYAGTWIYGILERALIPFGLHHVFYMPFWQTAVGGTAVIEGVTVQGAQNIFFAELASRTTEVFSVSATRFMSGKFPFMIFGLPGAALAMYRTAKPEKRKVAGGLLISAALTAMLTGITEPLEFTFLFVAPAMYAVHCVYAGLSYMLMHIFNVGVGMTFSGGIIDLTLFGILQGNGKTHWIWIVIVGAVYFVLYYFTFYFMISKMNLKTPGREDEGEETKLFTRSDFKAKTGVGPDGSAPAASSDPTSALILKGLGGKANLSDVDCCATRLRVTVLDAAKVSDTLLKQSGASGVIHKGNGVQVIYGPQVAVIKSNLVDFMETPESNSLDGISAAPAPQKAPAPAPAKKRDAVLCAHMSGAVVPMGEVQDEAFATCVLGEGAAIEPSEGRLYAPADAEVDNLFDTHHAIGLVTSEGVEVLLHIGINTVELAGQHFTAHVEAGQKVKKGDLLISFDMEAIKAAGYLCTTPMIVCNTDDYQSVKTLAQGDIKPGAPLVEAKG
ncbi:MAG: PTS transporter subunit EIIC [Oscillospiraceae bacterium]|jgi:alpha-glucoside-specific phosphotransferase system IIBC component/glucose-specific phosphotransferase system IIA component|nr:PTS transporter subunit EIIC [Oscillospiraceae bacterium]